VQVQVRPHPRGEEGTRISIEQAAKRAAAGRIDPRVRAWSIEKIVQAGNPPAVFDRAKVLLDALRRERIYIEDPTDSDFMPSAACTLAGCEGLIFLGEDCDGLVIAWLAACGSIGIFGAVVGHSYHKTGQLSHVLGAVWDGSRWYLGDPSTKQVFGTVSKPTRERWVSVHDGRLLCDKNNGCDPTKVEDPMAKMRPASEFVGVTGKPSDGKGMTGAPPAAEVTLIVGTPSEQATMRNEIAAGNQKLNLAMKEVLLEHEKLMVMREYLNLPGVDMDLVQSGYSSDVSPDEIWTQTDEDKFAQTYSAASWISQYGSEAISGVRPVARRSDTAEIVILGKPNETFVTAEGGTIVSGKLDDPNALQQTGTLGAVPVIWFVVAGVVVIVVAAVTTYALGHEAFGSYNQTLQTLQLQEMTKLYNYRRSVGDTAEQAASAVNVVTDSVAKTAKNNIEAEKASPMSKFMQTVETVAWTGLGIGIIVAGGYAMIQLAPLIKLRKQPA
jgi:hypothetical protein